MNAKIRYWKYNDGWSDVPQVFRKPDGPVKEYDESMVGWHCWAYPSDDLDFVGWMKTNMHGEYRCDYRFNSGNPMFTVHICDAADASLFKLQWL